MEFYTAVLRKSASYWVALCLENGLVGQGNTQDYAIIKLKEAIASIQDVYETEANIYSAPITIKELHEFLMLEEQEQNFENYELRKLYA